MAHTTSMSVDNISNTSAFVSWDCQFVGDQEEERIED